MDALKFEHVSHFFGEVRAVDDIELSVKPGELLCLLGPSGCGKTTALRIAAGLEAVQQGRILIDGKTVGEPHRNLAPEERSIGLVFQDFALFPHLSIADNVAFGISALPADQRAERVRASLTQVGMESYLKAFPHMLSGGQQQRVALARALAPQPKIMLLDEPFSGLDARLRHQVRDETLHVLKDAGTATLMVTHDPEEAMFMADRIALMREGRIEQEGRPSDLYFAPRNAFVTTFFGEANELEGVSHGGQVATPFGSIPTTDMPEGTPVSVLVRPEALRLKTPGSSSEPADNTATVLAARMLGRSSLVHLKLDDGREAAGEDRTEPQEVQYRGHPLHWHARIPGRYLPAEGEALDVYLDRSQAFVFPRNITN
ncbi:ABC transporter ATP-binding protein [Denitrobaculum tricleocarpae]|uniref:ABC transporter ATP-binding protein n=1 Tax=Denitrobaculum tricleocarpae TaxID=2591009 RepID=A0A545TQ04_9PROT|nr:ABC transporter ATP-binding protein [Denitrobaculum tricleocarpae]TQV79299.1 ABC transporter ATP-binding protein [Denitrobaculum tricleocarpae]